MRPRNRSPPVFVCRPHLWTAPAQASKRKWWASRKKWKLARDWFFLLPAGEWWELLLKRPGEKWASLARVWRVLPSDWSTPTFSMRLYMSIFDKLPGEGGPAFGDRLPEDPGFLDRFPSLWQFLTEDQYGPDKPRERSGLTLRIENGTWKAWLSEPSREAGIEATAETLDALLKALEARVASDKPGWRSMAGKRGKKR